jgi:hypothetical protein
MISNKSAQKIVGYSFLLGDEEKQFMISYRSQIE